jgi:O-antigen/teichoic acid export membrane protein
VQPIDLTRPPNRKEAVLWHICGGWLTNFVLIAQGILLVPLYIHYLGERLYGFWLATGGILAWLTMFNLGVSAVTKQRCAAAFARREMLEVKNYFYHGAFIMGWIVLFFAVALWALGAKFLSWLQIDAEYASLITTTFYVAGASVAGRLLNEFAFSLAVSLQRNQYAMLAGALGDILGLVTIIVCLVVLRFGLWAIVIGMLVRTLLPLALNAVYAVRLCRAIDTGWRLQPAVFKDYLKTMPSIMASIMSGSFAANLPTVLITRWIGPEATVMFSVTEKMVLIVQSFINHAQAGLYTACTHYFNDPSVTPVRLSNMMRRLTRSFIVAACLSLSLYGLLNHGFVNVWTSEAQFAGQSVTALFALAAFFVMRSKLFVGFGVAVGSIQSANGYRCFENLLLAVLLVVGIHGLGLIGVPLAFILSSLIAEFPYFRMFQKANRHVHEAFKPLRWAWLLLAAALGVASALAPYFEAENWLAFLMKSPLVVIPVAGLGIWLMPDIREQLAMRLPYLRKFFAPA